MRKADLQKNHQWFEGVLDRYRDFSGRLLRARRNVRRQDKKEIVEATALKLCAYWESFVDQELLDCVNINSSKLAEWLDVKPTNLNIEMSRAILFREGYLDFKSVGALKAFAKRVLAQDVNPFRLIQPSTAIKIDELFVIRNYLVHRSFAAKRSLRKMYRRNYRMRYFREPGTFLVAHGGRRLDTYRRALVDASQRMAQ